VIIDRQNEVSTEAELRHMDELGNLAVQWMASGLVPFLKPIEEDLAKRRLSPY
jgi:hypothetical protein